MLLLLALIYCSQKTIDAAPTILPIFDTRAVSTPSASAIDPDCTCPNTRSMWNIVWTCLVTIFACAWVSVHPNIPAPGKKEWQVALMRLELMIWTIIAPEMMIFWAIRQWVGARKLAMLYGNKEHHWTKTHGYFIQMGGFVLYEGQRRIGVLSPERLAMLSEARLIEFPNITEEEIEDRSKGDALSKMLVLGQTTWFIAQCITRRAEGLVTTELELVTLAFAALNSFMYFFWWNKPLDVRTTVPVYLLDTPLPEKDSDPSDSATLLSNPDGPVRRETEGPEHEQDPETRRYCGRMIMQCLFNLFIRSPYRGIMAIFARLGDMAEFAGRSNTISEHQVQVHPFYAMNTTDKDSNHILGAVSLIGTMFGCIHCVGWNFIFPTHAEAIIWKICSVIVTGVPFLMLIPVVCHSVYFQTETFCLERFVEDVKDLLTTIEIYIGLPIYIVARLVLLAEALITLRNLSPEALLEVEWTSFLPHI